MSARKLVVSAYLQYILIGVGILLLAVFVRQIGGVLLTFLMAGVLAYALNPVARRLERLHVPRIVAVLAVFTALVLAVVAAMLVLIIPAVDQVQRLISRPEIVINGAIGRSQDLMVWVSSLPYVGEYVPATMDQDLRQRLLQFAQSNIPPAGAILQGALGFIGGVFGVFGTLLNLVLMLIVSIYMLLDKERILRATLATIPETVRDQILELFAAVERTLMRYLKAQFLLCLIMGVIGWAIVYFTGRFADSQILMNYALVIGVWVGVTELIPVLGAFLGAVPAVVLALVAGPTEALIVAVLFLIAQQLEGNILVPKVMGGSVGVHPLWVMFAMLSATALYGLVGALFAVPIVAIISASIRYLQGTLVFERWGSSPVSTMGSPEGEVKEEPLEEAGAGAASRRALEGE